MRQQYGVGEIVKNVYYLIYTKLFWGKARLIRLPFYLRGKKFFQYGEGLTIGYGCRFEMYDAGTRNEKKIIIGKKCLFGDYVHISACQSVFIGDNCLFASHILVTDNSHGNYFGINCDLPVIPPNERKLRVQSVKIGNNVWVGENVCILPGSEIGDGCIIGAGAVVNRCFPKNCIIAGVPAKIVKIYNEETREWEKLDKENLKMADFAGR